MRICFNARPAYDKASPLIYKHLKQKIENLKGTFVVSNDTDQASVLSIIPDAKTESISQFIEKYWGKGSPEKLSQFEKAYSCYPIWNYIYVDRFLVNYSYNDVIQYVCGMFEFYEYIFSEREYNYYFDETIATTQSYIAYIVAKRYDAKYIAVMAARGMETTHHYVVIDPFQHQFGFDKNYKTKEYDNKTKETASRLYEKYFSNYEKPSSMAFVKSKPSISIKLLFRFVKEFLNPDNHNKYDLINYKSYNNNLKQFVFYFKYLICKRYYADEMPNKKFVYYPLHYQPEASTLVCASKYEKQLFYIDSWAKSLPGDTILIVKEHYALVGHRAVDFYRSLKKYPNVTIISPWYPSLELIKKSEAVTTLTGTAGWEAMIIGKPVYLGGKIYFDNAPGIYDTTEAYLAYSEELCGASQEDVLTYLCEYVTNIFPGAVYFTRDEYLNEDNIMLIADSISNAIDRMENNVH